MNKHICDVYFSSTLQILLNNLTLTVNLIKSDFRGPQLLINNHKTAMEINHFKTIQLNCINNFSKFCSAVNCVISFSVQMTNSSLSVRLTAVHSGPVGFIVTVF